MNTQDAVIQLLAIRGFGRESHIETRRAQIAFLNKFPFEQQSEIILGVCLADRDHAMSIIQGMRDEIAEWKKEREANPNKQWEGNALFGESR